MVTSIDTIRAPECKAARPIGHDIADLRLSVPRRDVPPYVSPGQVLALMPAPRGATRTLGDLVCAIAAHPHRSAAIRALADAGVVDLDFSTTGDASLVVRRRR